MTDEQKAAYDWAKRQKYGSVAATYARELAGVIDELQSQLAASERREKAAVEDLHGYCKACINIAKTIDFDELAKPICRECNKIIKQNWQWRGAEKGAENEQINKAT